MPTKQATKQKPSTKRVPGTVASIMATGSAPAQTKIRGYEGQVYYAVNGGASAIFANVVDFDLDIKVDSIDASDRSTVGWKDKLGGLKEWTGTIKANAIQSGVDLQAFVAAVVGGLTLTGSFRPQDVTAGIAYTDRLSSPGSSTALPTAGSRFSISPSKAAERSS